MSMNWTCVSSLAGANFEAQNRWDKCRSFEHLSKRYWCNNIAIYTRLGWKAHRLITKDWWQFFGMMHGLISTFPLNNCNDSFYFLIIQRRPFFRFGKQIHQLYKWHHQHCDNISQSSNWLMLGSKWCSNLENKVGDPQTSK